MRLSDREYRALQAGATVFNMSMAEFARSALLDKVAELGTSGEVLERYEEDRKRREAAKETLQALAGELAGDARPAAAGGTQPDDDDLLASGGAKAGSRDG